MKSHLTLPLAIFVLLRGVALVAQPNNSGPAPGRSADTPGASVAADEAWGRIVVPAPPAFGERSTSGPKSAEQVKAAARDYAAQQNAAAQSAREFALDHPTDSRAPLAKKIEAVGLLRGVWPLPEDRGESALRTAITFTNDPTQTARDRFEVAALLAEQQHKIRTQGRRLADDSAAYEKSAEALRTTFGDTPEVMAYYLGVADAGDVATSHRAALAVVQSAAPEALRRQAQVVVERHGLQGNPLPVTLRDTRNRNVNLRAAGRPTVLCVWSASRGPLDYAALAAAHRSAPANTRWVLVALDTTPAELAAATAKLPFSATHCRLDGPDRAAFAAGLKVRRLPYAYVLQPGGNLSTYGRLAELPAMLADLNNQ